MFFSSAQKGAYKMQRDNAKEHVKLYKSKKNWVAATIFTTALGVVGVSVSSSANADNINSSSVNSSSTSKVASSSVKPSNTVTLRSSSVAKSSIQAPVVLNQAVKSSSTQSSNVASKKASLQSQINQKKQVLSNEQSQQSNLQKQYQQDSQTAQQASQTKAAQISQIDREASSKKQAARNTIDSLTNKGLQSQLNKVDSQINDYHKTYNKLDSQEKQVDSQIDSLTPTLKNKQEELDNLQNSTYNNSEGVVENVAHMDHNSHNYKLMFGPSYVTPDNDKTNINWNDPVAQINDTPFSSSLKQHDLINGHDLTQAQAKEICEALMAKINATREARGEQPFIMSNAMFNAVMERAAGPEHDQHSAEYIDKSLEDNGISAKDWRAECLAGASADNNVAQIIMNCQEQIFEMLDDDGGQWGHRTNFLQNYGQPVQASFGIAWDPENSDYVLMFDVANYHGNGSDDLMNEVKDWENQTDPRTTNNLAQANTLQSDINDLQKKLDDLNSQDIDLNAEEAELGNKFNIVDLCDKANELEYQVHDSKVYGTSLFDENQLSPNDKQAYDNAQNILKTIDQWRQSQINKIGSQSYSDLVKKSNADKAALDKLNQQIAQTKQEINDLENQLNALDGTKTSANKPSKNLNGQSNKQTQNSTSSTLTPAGTSTVTTTTTSSKNNDVLPGSDSIVEAPQETSEPKSNGQSDKQVQNSTSSTLTPAGTSTVTTTTTSSKNNDVLPGPDSIVEAPQETSEPKSVVANHEYGSGIDPLTGKALKDETPAQQQKAKAYVESLNKDANSSASSTSNVANRVVANISYKKGIDPLTDHLLSDETPAQRQKAKTYIDHLNNNAQTLGNSQPIQFAFKQNEVKADNVKNNAKKTLPTTGENQDKGAIALGIEAASLGLALGGLSFLKRKHN